MSSIEKIAKEMSQDELIDALFLTAKSTRLKYRQMQRNCLTEINSGLTSRAKSTTLVANSWKITESFNKEIENMRIIIKYIF